MAKRVKHGKAYNIGQGMVRIVGNNPNITDGVSIGANTSDNLQVDNNEVLVGVEASKSGKTLYPIDNNIKVLSAQPMLGGVSPVQLLYGGMAPDKVFAMQEIFKDIHGINDDGSKAQFGILRKIKEKLSRKSNSNTQTPVKGIDWSGIVTTNNRPYNQEYINYINDSLVNYGYNNNQRAAILANIIEESGGNPFAEGPGGYYGLLQWGSDRYTKTKETDTYKEIDNQLKYLHDTIGETKDKKSWTHGGKGSGYNSFTDAIDAYNSDELNKVMHGFTWGYVRPAGKQNSYLNRQKVADQLIKLEGFKFGGRKQFQAGGDNISMRIDSNGNLIDSIQPSVVTAKLPAKFNGSQAAAARYAEGYKFGKKVTKKRDEVAPYFMPLVMGPLAPNAILGEMGGKFVDSLIQQTTNYKKTGWSDAVTSFLDDDSKAKKIGETIADFINPGYMLGSIATPIKSSLINSNWKPSIKSKYDTVPSSIKNTLNIDTEANKRLRNIIAKQVGNTTENPNRQKQVYNKALYYLGQAFDDVPENIQKDILNNAEILDNFVTRVRWGEGKDMVSSLKYEANKTANIFKQNDIAKKRLKYRYKNVPTLLKNPLHNESPLFQSIVNTYGKHIANKARYRLAQLLKDKGYNNTIGITKDILDNLTDIAADMNSKHKGFKPLIYIPERNLTTNTKLNIDKFVKKYGKPISTDPAEGIINPELQEIARISPKYAGQIYAKEVLGNTPEEIVNDLLTKKWSFIRGINDATGTLNIEDAKIAMGKIAENAKGGRSDIRAFPSILPYEDVTYFSNSPTTAISYTYPTQQGTGYIGIFGKKGQFVEGNNLIDKWIKNQLPDDNILEAPSTIIKDTPGIKIDEDKLKSFEIGLKRGKNRGKLQRAGEADNYLYYLTKPNRNDSGYRHFLIKGNRGEQIPYLELKDIREVPKASVNSDEFNLLLKEFDVDAHDLNRGHNNKPSLSFSLGKQFGGQTNINSLGERPNAKYRKQMKNKRNKAALGRQQFSISGLPAFDFTIPNTFGNYSLNKPFYPTYVDGPLIGLRIPQSTLNVPSFPTNFTPKSTVGQINPFMGTKPTFGTSTTGTQKTNSVGDLTKSSGLSTTAMSAIGAGINTLGSLIGAGIQQSTINSLEAPKRTYTLLNPVKLKTKININPQIARMREMQAQLADAARRTSGSSRNTYQKILANHNRLLDSAMDLYGRKENIETELINRDRLNQQQVAQTNATNVMNTVNYNNEASTEMRNRQQVATSNNWTTALNTTAGAWAGPNGFIDRANALRVKAGELYTQAIANPTAARLLYGNIDFTTGANKRRAFNTIYDFLNNNRLG